MILLHQTADWFNRDKEEVEVAGEGRMEAIDG